jgi:cell volume regulation protein A
MTLIISLCLLLLVAYLFDLTAARTKIPSVILLLLLGWVVREATLLFSIAIPDLSSTLPILGTIGLILIVLEGSLELELNNSKIWLIKKSSL